MDRLLRVEEGILCSMWDVVAELSLLCYVVYSAKKDDMSDENIMQCILIQLIIIPLPQI